MNSLESGIGTGSSFGCPFSSMTWSPYVEGLLERVDEPVSSNHYSEHHFPSVSTGLCWYLWTILGANMLDVLSWRIEIFPLFSSHLTNICWVSVSLTVFWPKQMNLVFILESPHIFVSCWQAGGGGREEYENHMNCHKVKCTREF